MFRRVQGLDRAAASGVVAILALALMLAACGPATPAPTHPPLPTYTPYPTPLPVPTIAPVPTEAPAGQCSGIPVITAFTANPTTIQVGETATLHWGPVENAQATVLVSPDGRLGVATPGETTVQPDGTTTYALYAACGNTIVQQQVTVEVTVPGGCAGVPDITSFSASPATIQAGQTSTLKWGPVDNASAAILLSPDGKEGVATPGEKVIEPNLTTTYVLVAFCGSDAVQKNVTVEVEDTSSCGGAPVISSFTAEPDTIAKGGSSTLEWGLVANASGAYLTDGEQIIGIATPGREVVAPEQTTVYTLVAFCGGTIVQADQTVTVE
jgi:hypothetical protein